MKAASALYKGSKAEPVLAEAAVMEAMEKADLDIAGLVILFLSSDFARAPKPAILAAARAANTMQITGCTTVGVFTEEDWILDAPAAAVMVLGPDDATPEAASDQDWKMTLAAPSAIETQWLKEVARRFGGVSGDATGKGPYKVWQAGRISPGGRCETPFTANSLRVDFSRGVEILSSPLAAMIQGHDVLTLGNVPALAHLARHLPPDLDDEQVFPLHLLMAGVTWGDPDTALAENRYHLLALLAVDLEARSVTLAQEIQQDTHLFWAIRRPESATQDMSLALDRLAADLPVSPSFGLCFQCIGRGPYFYDGKDRDLEQITQHFPGMPLLGFYGNGEIVHSQGRNQLLQYSTVLALHHDHVQS